MALKALAAHNCMRGMLKLKGWEEPLCTFAFGLELPAQAYGNKVKLGQVDSS